MWRLHYCFCSEWSAHPNPRARVWAGPTGQASVPLPTLAGASFGLTGIDSITGLVCTPYLRLPRIGQVNGCPICLPNCVVGASRGTTSSGRAQSSFPFVRHRAGLNSINRTRHPTHACHAVHLAAESLGLQGKWAAASRNGTLPHRHSPRQRITFPVSRHRVRGITVTGKGRTDCKRVIHTGAGMFW
jgi:hypothetical protein